MGQSDSSLADIVAAARERLRAQTLPVLTVALVLHLRVASSREGYDLRALSSALGLLVLLALALAVATLDAVLALGIAVVREVARRRVRFGSARARTLAASVYGQVVPPARRLWAGPAAAYAAGARGLGRIAALIPVPSLPLRWVRIVAVTTTMTFVFATALGTTGVITQQGRVALGASTTVSVIAGEVSVRAADATDFTRVNDGTILRAGMTVRTGAASYAVLTYFEGSTVSLEPNTTVLIEALASDPDGSTVISMRQQLGRTWHSVSKLLHQGSKYEVRTPTLTATVRGTAFEVGVEQDAASGEIVSSVVTREGAVGAAKPATAADPAPAEVIVPAGFQATAKAAEPLAPPEPAPEPERTVTVTVGASNAVVVDPVGRANGEKGGKIVLQTPGAKVQKVDGKLVVTLPNMMDGKISTVIAPTAQTVAGPVRVVTVVAERGGGEARSEETVQVPANVSAPAVVTGIEVKRSDTARPAEVRVLAPAEREEIKAPKLPEPPKPSDPPRPELVPTEKKDDPDKGEGSGAKMSGVVDVFVKATLAPLSIEDAARRAEEARKAEERAKEEAARREEQRWRENEQRAEELRRAEERAREEAARLEQERRRAEERSREASSDARRSEQTARGGSGPAPAPGPASFVENVLKALAPQSNEDDARRRAEEARRAEEKAKEEAARIGDERRRAEETARQDAIKRAEEDRRAAQQKAEELRKAEEKAKADAAREIERIREIESKAREQAQRLEAEKRREAERLLEEFRRAEEKAREDAARRIGEQRRAEERAKEEAERRLEQLRQAQERAKEEAARADEERRRAEQLRSEERSRSERPRSNFLPAQTIDPLPGSIGPNRGGSGRP